MIVSPSQSVFSAVFPATPSPVYKDFWVVPGNHGPRWIVPCDAKAGFPTMRQWRPYHWASWLKWQGLLGMYDHGYLGRVPGVESTRLNIANIAEGFSENLLPVVYVGTPGPQQKAVVTLVGAESGSSQAVLKVALGQDAATSIRREAHVLSELERQSQLLAPRLLWIDDHGRRSCQSVILGKLTGRVLTRRHVAWLLHLPRSGQATTLDAQHEMFIRVFEKNFSEEAALIEPALAALAGAAPLPLTLVHGDFAPWNLKWLEHGTIVAIDWEEACFGGLPLHDICHFYAMQAHLFGGRGVLETLDGSFLVREYLQGMGVVQESLRPLFLHYLLTMLAGLGGDCSPAYRRFLLDQIGEVTRS